MKNNICLIVLVSLLAFPIFAFSQIKIEGLGIFKIGKLNTKQLDSLMQSNGIALNTCIGHKCAVTKKNKLNYTLIKPNFTDLSDNSSSTYYSEFVKSYQLNNHMINKKYSTGVMNLYFYKDLLFYMTITDPDFDIKDDLEIKYGKGKLSSSKRDDKCYIGREKIPYESETYFTTWESDLASLSFILSSTRNYDDCEPTVTSLIICSNDNLRKEIDVTNQQEIENLKNREIEIKKKSLIDL